MNLILLCSFFFKNVTGLLLLDFSVLDSKPMRETHQEHERTRKEQQEENK